MGTNDLISVVISKENLPSHMSDWSNNTVRAGQCCTMLTREKPGGCMVIQVRRCRGFLAGINISLSLPLWLTQVISKDLHFSYVWLKASCVKAVQTKTACHYPLSSTLLHGNNPALHSALLFLCFPMCLSVVRTGKSLRSLFCTIVDPKSGLSRSSDL